MVAKKKKAKKVKAKSSARKRSSKRGVKGPSARRTAKSVKGGLLTAVKPPTPSPKPVGNLNPVAPTAGDGAV